MGAVTRILRRARAELGPAERTRKAGESAETVIEGEKPPWYYVIFHLRPTSRRRGLILGPWVPRYPRLSYYAAGELFTGEHIEALHRDGCAPAAIFDVEQRVSPS
jgi:hypothetical protein